MSNDNTQYIPTDLLKSILKRLPPKPLIKFLTVSKSWYSLITNPNFIASHLRHHKSLSLHHLFLHEPHSRYSLFHYGHPFNHRTILPSPPSHFNSVVASFNGLICLFNSKQRHLLLWNPAINKSIRIQRLPILHSSSLETFTVIGLGFDSYHNDYKLVSFDYNRRLVVDEVSPPYAQVYSLNGGVRLGWRRVLIPDTIPVFDLSHLSESCSVNKLIHWIVFRREVDNYHENGVGIISIGAWILTFDPRIDCFGAMQLPKLLYEAVDPDLCLAVVDDSLVVIHIFGDEELFSNYCAMVWKLEEGGGEEEEAWKVLYRISLPYVYGMNPNLWDEEEGKVFIATSLGTLIVFNVKSGWGSCGFKFNGQVALIVGQAFGFTASLVLLDRCSGMSWLRKEQLQGPS